MKKRFVSIGGESWVNVDHIIAVEAKNDPNECLVVTQRYCYVVKCSPRDFLNRMVSVS